MITEKMMEKFHDTCGDNNPLHVDDSFAKDKGFPDKVVYGMLMASLISKMGVR